MVIFSTLVGFLALPRVGRELTLVLSLLAVTTSAAQAGIIPAASCSTAHVQAAIDTAVTGDVVTVPAGSCTWNTYVVIPSGKNITLQGAGAGVTTLTASPAEIVLVYISDGSAARVTGFTFTCAIVQPQGRGWRFDHNTMTCATFGHSLWVRGQSKFTSPSGLVDHNTFINRGTLVQGYAAVTLAQLDGSTHWSAPLGLGNDEAMYVEDNTYIFTKFGNAVDCNYGGSYVFRHNSVTDTSVEAHSVQGPNRACRKWEIYENTITNTGAIPVARWMFLRGGTGVVFNNTMNGTVTAGTNISVDNRRSFSTVDVFRQCDGTSAWDGNSPGETGWPCRDQIGRGGDVSAFVTTGYISQRAEPAYFWGNIINGQVGNVRVENGADLHIKSDRDYVANKGPKPGYAPFAYPHPLTSSSPLPTPSAPKNLKISPLW